MLNNLEMLLNRNHDFLEQFKKNSIIELILSTQMSSHICREKLLACIQVFSNYFQRAVMIKYVLCDDSRFLSIAEEHLKDEFFHNVSLMQDRQHKPPIWDPILEATSSWFVSKMHTLNNEAKIILIHLVLETSANYFFPIANKIMLQYEETNYFSIHSQIDEKHERMGMELLSNLSDCQYPYFFEVQEHGWQMMETTCNQITELVTNGS